MKQIPLANSQKFALVDDEDFDRLSRYTWYRKISLYTYYARTKISGIEIYMHNFIVSPPIGLTIDHKNYNGLDNQKHNFRFVTRSQQAHHRRKADSKTSKYIGVSWKKNIKMWMAYIRINKKLIYLGYFHIEKEAALAYNKAAIKYYSEFANLNKLE